MTTFRKWGFLEGLSLEDQVFALKDMIDDLMSPPLEHRAYHVRTQLMEKFTPQQRSIMELLHANLGKTVSHKALMAAASLYGTSYYESTLDNLKVQILRCRQRLKALKSDFVIITHYQAGYRMVIQEAGHEVILGTNGTPYHDRTI